ncbi:TGACG-sequence-specific DNA-binding protein TGA-2.1-like [Fagus crenata]
MGCFEKEKLNGRCKSKTKKNIVLKSLLRNVQCLNDDAFHEYQNPRGSLLVIQLEPLTEQQLVGIYNLQQSSQQAEDALSHGMEALQQSLAETLANGTTRHWRMAETLAIAGTMY